MSSNPTTPDDAPKTGSDENGNGETTGLDRSFLAALRAAENAPESADAWDHLEELADKLQKPDPVAELYRAVLERSLPKRVFARVAERAVGFHEEWFGDTPDKIESLMGRIIELDADATWAFERLSVMLTSAGQWDELLSLYDRTIAATHDGARKQQLLEDAAQAAKDFADKPERAADYMQQLLALDPSNGMLVQSLERLLERQGRHADLIELWRARVDGLAPEEARETRLRIATCLVEQLGDPQRAVAQLRELLDESPGHARACEQLERILELDGAAERADAIAAARRQALALLRKNYLVAERPQDVVRVLDKALGFADDDERRPIHRELGARLAILGRDVEAMAHYRALLLTDPTDPDARKQLRQLADRCGRFDLHSEALVAAAEAASDGAQQAAVLLEAAHLMRTVLDDAPGAIALYGRVLDNGEAERAIALAAAHALDELLAGAERHDERLAVLEKLTHLERSKAVRRNVLGEAARLAEALGDADRALSNWREVLAADPDDVEALAAVAQLLERNERWAELVEALERRANAKVIPLQRRADLVRIAEVQLAHLGHTDAAIGSWLKVRKEFGENSETIAALDALMSGAGRYEELAHLLGSAAAEERSRSAALLTRLGDIHLQHIGDAEQALAWYGEALAVEPANEGAREGLRALTSVVEHAPQAAEILARAYEETDDWALTLQLLEPRINATTSRTEQARLLREAARLHVDRADNPESALACLCRALPIEPDNLATEAAIMRLAEQTGRWVTVAASVRMAADAVKNAPARRAQLRKLEGQIHELQLDDSEAALTAYRAASEAQPDDIEALEAIVRCASAARSWDIAATAAVASAAARERVRPEIIAALESHAADADAWRPMALAMAASVETTPLPDRLAQQLEVAIAGWFRDRAGDFDAAEQAATRAASRGAPRLDTLQLLARLQRRHPGPALIGTLLKIDRLEDGSLDALYEAAQLAVELGDNVALSQQVLEALYRKAGGMWLRDEPASGQVRPAEIAQWALDALIAHHISAGNTERAVHTLLDGTRLPLDEDAACDLRRRAADMLAERGDRMRAIDVLRGVLDHRPNDLDALRRVAAMCEQEGRVSEALALRLHELSLVEDVERRLQLRLDHSRLTAALEARGGRVASLKANLQDAPGHEASLDELSAVLDERGKHADLAEILEDQARKLEERDEPERAAGLWARVAALWEAPLADVGRAIAAHTRVVALSSSAGNTDVRALDALARLHLERNEPADAAHWLEKRLEGAAKGERVAVLLKLARARLRADQRDAAIAALASAFSEAPRNGEVRKLLLEQYRHAKDWEALAAALTTAALAIADEQTVLSYAREAADIYHHRLGRPEASVPVLAKAVDLARDDRELRSMLAEGLYAAGQHDEAALLLESVIADFGRRRSPERAQAHLLLARVTAARGRTTEAVDQLDTASKMDAGNATILKTLAELAREDGQLDRAERALRTLLVTVRREAAPETLPIGPTEVLFELSRIAADRGDAAKADELMESVLESLVQHDHEAPRIQDKLGARGEHGLLERLLRHRLGYVDKPHTRGRIYAQLGEVLAGPLGQPAQGLAARLEAVKADPGSPLHHQAAWDLAVSLDQLDSYVSVVEALLSDERADSSALVRCELLLRLGEVLEKERGDLDRAAALYGQAGATGVRAVDVWRAQARVAGARGDAAEQLRLLGQLANLGEDQAETRADALYRLAEVQLASPDTLEEGLASLQKGLQDAFRSNPPRTERAAMILRRASEQHASHEGLLDVYEQVARRSDDQHTLLHYLERRVAHPDATPEQAREAVELALELGAGDHVDALMLRAAEIGHAQRRAGDLARVDWALLGLAERRMQAGDLAGAVKWLSAATEVAPLESVLVLSERLAERAARPDGDLTLAAKVYERIVERAPQERRAWGPLADLYSRLDDVEHLERMVEETLDGVQDTSDRNALRVSLARALLGRPARAADAVALLQDVLVEQPDQREAQALLFDHLERSGQHDEVIALLGRQLDAATDRGDADGIKATSLALAARVEASDRHAALDILRRALRWAEGDRELVLALLERLGDDDDIHERCALTEALIRLEPPEQAGPRALELLARYEALDDEEGALRALQLGAEQAPDNAAIRSALEERYRARGDFAGLAESLLHAAERSSDEGRKAALLRETAAVRREQLSDAAGAAELLRQACALAPGDTALRIELARSQAGAGLQEDALRTLGEALDAAGDPARLSLLSARAELRSAAGDETGAIADLEQAFALDAHRVAPALQAALLRALDAAMAIGDPSAERAHTLRCVELMLLQHARDDASRLLASWCERHGDDVDALRRLRDVDTADGRWQAVADTCRRLIRIEQGPAQIDAALGLSHAHAELGDPDGAREGLEHVLSLQPDSRQVRGELRKIYEQLEDQSHLARLLLEDAKSVDDKAEKAELLRRVGHIFVDSGDMVAAIPPLREANELAPGQPAAIVPLADAYILAGWFDDANSLLDDAIRSGKGRRTPEICVYYHRKAQVADAQGDRRRQVEYLLEAHQCNKKNGLVAADLANVAEELEQWDLAAKTLRTITLIDTECPISRAEAFLRQGRIAKLQGDEKSAKMWARRAKREAPESEEIDAFLEALGERTR